MGAIGKKLRSIEGGKLAFFCPGCKCAHALNVGAVLPPPRWYWNGNGDRPTFTPSVRVSAREWTDDDGTVYPRETECHSVVIDGRIQFLADSRHALAGKTVDLPDWGN